MRRFFTQQFKRSCSPDGPITGNCNLNPQIGWVMPSDTSVTPWIELTDKTEEDMMKVKNLGRKSLKEIKDKLTERGLAFKISE